MFCRSDLVMVILVMVILVMVILVLPSLFLRRGISRGEELDVLLYLSLILSSS